MKQWKVGIIGATGMVGRWQPLGNDNPDAGNHEGHGNAGCTG